MYLDETLVAYVKAYYPTATTKDIKRVYNYAQHKLFTIIENEGDGNGKRYEPRYFAQLIAEQLIADWYALSLMTKNNQNERACKSRLPQNRNNIITDFFRESKRKM